MNGRFICAKGQGVGRIYSMGHVFLSIYIETILAT